jgi:hypothetical protein
VITIRHVLPSSQLYKTRRASRTGLKMAHDDVNRHENQVHLYDPYEPMKIREAQRYILNALYDITRVASVLVMCDATGSLEISH